jgi:hypothetical protein
MRVVVSHCVARLIEPYPSVAQSRTKLGSQRHEQFQHGLTKIPSNSANSEPIATNREVADGFPA